MKTQTKIITYLIAILMLLQPLMVTVAYATETGEVEIEVVENTELQTITIGDKALYEAIKKQIGNKASYIDSENTIDIYTEDLNSITELYLAESEISDLSGIENFTELVRLNLTRNKLTSNSGLDKLNSLTKLTYLDLSRNQIEDVSGISSLLNKDGFEIHLDQDIKVIDFVSIIPQPEEYEDAENILINDLKETIDLPQILLAYNDMTINIEEIRADGVKIDKSEFEDYIEIKDDKLRILNRDSKQYEIKIKLNGELPNHGTTCEIKAFRIDTENQEGIVFKNENLYKAIKEKYEYALGIRTEGFLHENYDEWSDYEFMSGSEGEWVFDNDNLIIVANKKELRMIETVTVSSRAISSLDGIEKFVGLKTLALENNLIIDVSKIVELHNNKKITTEEFKQKFNLCVEKLSELVGEYETLKTQIEAIDKEIEELRKAIANGEEITDTETTDEKEARKERLELLQERKIAKIESLIDKVEEISNPDGTEGISSLLTSPSTRNEIERIIEEANLSNDNVLEQKEIIENNKLGDFANQINTILDNLTAAEMLELIAVELQGEPIVSEEQVVKAEAKYAIEHMKKHIDQTVDNRVDDLIDDINDLTGSEVSDEDNEGNKKEASVLRNELKAALNRYYDSKNGITPEEVVDLCIDMTGIDESEMLVEVKDSIIPEIKDNISSYASDVSEEVIEYLRTNIINHIFDLDRMKEENKIIIEEILVPTYEDLYELLAILRNVLETRDYLNDPDDMLRIIRRLQSVTDEDINEVIKLADLTTVVLDRNLISDADKLSEIETLEVLSVSNNYISNFGFDKFQNIKKLYIGHNSIRNPEITGMEKIEVLDLSYNWINDTSKINLSGMPKLYALNLGNNKIDDIDHLINSKNDYITSLEYKNLGEYWSAGNTSISVAAQIIDINLKIHNTKVTEQTIELPKIFSQMKKLESIDLKVQYEWLNPCLTVYSDGTKVVLDTSEKNVVKQGLAYMLTDNILDYWTCRINYIVVDDETAPTISAVAGVSETFTNGDVTLTIEGAADEGAGLDRRPYSFDNGATWQISNTKTFTENTDNIIIKVKDIEGNIYTHEPINITNIDKTAPVIAVNSEVVDAETGKSSVTISITEEQSGLSDENKYEYYLSTSKDEQVDGELITFVPGTPFEIGEGLEGTYYMFVSTVSDKVGHVSEAAQPVEFTFVIPDKTAPTITGVTGNPENWTNEDVILTIEGATDDRLLDNEPYSFDGGASWQVANTKTYTQNTENIEILVRDAEGNVYTHEKVNISKIDKTAPTIDVNVETTDDGKAKITITAIDAESDLNAENDYKYNVSTSKEELTNEDWVEYGLGETFEIGEELEDGTYYVTIKPLKDNADNESGITPIEVKLETKPEPENGEDGEENGEETLEYLTLSGITKLVRAYITDDYSNLPESFEVIAGENGEFELEEITKTIRLYLSL